MKARIELDPTFLAALEELMAAGTAGFNIHEIAADAASAFIDRIYSINQYIQIDARARKALVAIYVGRGSTSGNGGARCPSSP